jgi:NADH:ubiquinone reductase (H+-translocating)
VRVVVAGGGYAGLACLLDLRKLAPRAQLHLVDPGAAHVKLAQLHQTVRRPLAAISVPFEELARRCRFAHHRAALGDGGAFDAEALRRWAAAGAVDTTAGPLPFDFLVVATGARPRLQGDAQGHVYDQLALRDAEARRVVARTLAEHEAATATVVGGGPSGIQFAFELAELTRRRAPAARVRLVDSHERVLATLPQAAHAHALARMTDLGIEYLPRTAYVGQAGARVRVRDADGERELESHLTLLFGGVEAYPFALAANRFGQAVVGGATLARVFTAGDCSRYAARGLDTATAQAAVRKGKHVAANVTRLQRRRPLVAYAFQGLGYVVSLGAGDAVGWLLVPDNVVRGAAAAAIKRVVEAQYDLFVEGLDTYVV